MKEYARDRTLIWYFNTAMVHKFFVILADLGCQLVYNKGNKGKL